MTSGALIVRGSASATVEIPIVLRWLLNSDRVGNSFAKKIYLGNPFSLGHPNYLILYGVFLLKAKAKQFKPLETWEKPMIPFFLVFVYLKSLIFMVFVRPPPITFSTSSSCENKWAQIIYQNRQILMSFASSKHLFWWRGKFYSRCPFRTVAK